jgi:signal transduction histidine kinase
LSRRSWLLVLVLGVVVLATLLVFHFVLREVEADQLFELEDRLTSSARTLAVAMSDELSRRDLEGIEGLLLSAQASNLARIRILDANRTLIADSYGPITEQEGLRFRPEIEAAFTGRIGAYTRFADENDRSLALFVAAPVMRSDSVIGAVYVSRSTDSILQRLGILRRNFQGALLGMTVAILLGSLWLTRNVSLDLNRLGAVSELEGFHPKANDEVERVRQSLTYLVDSLRQKVSELEDERDKTRRFIEDIAHELKTPVTGLQGAVENLKPSAPDHPLFRNIERETERLARLTTLLLELRKLEYYQLKPRLFDMASLIDTVLDSFRQHAGPRLVENLPQECPVLADPAKIQRVLDNLVENALRCAPVETEVTVTLSQDEKAVSVTVEDLGPGVSPQDAEQILGRGQRGSGPVGHLGLGLAIAMQIVEMHGGEFRLDPDRPQGAAFTFRLPKNVASET